MCIDARKTSLTGVQNSKQNRLAATRLGHRRFAARGYVMCIDARKTSLTGVQNSKKKSARRYAARSGYVIMCIDARKISLTGVQMIAHKKSARRYAARGRIVVGSNPPPPWKKARSAPAQDPHLERAV